MFEASSAHVYDWCAQIREGLKIRQLRYSVPVEVEGAHRVIVNGMLKIICIEIAV